MNYEKEIERLAVDLNHIIQFKENGFVARYATAEAFYALGYRKASYVAREIFEEIEEIFKKRIAFYTEMAKQSKFSEKHYAETMIKNCEIYLQEIAELKKKYTEITEGGE